MDAPRQYRVVGAKFRLIIPGMVAVTWEMSYYCSISFEHDVIPNSRVPHAKTAPEDECQTRNHRAAYNTTSYFTNDDEKFA